MAMVPDTAKPVITIYTTTGDTLRFHEVEDVGESPSGTTLTFSYRSASRPDKKARARFYLSAIAGYSLDLAS